MPAISIRDVPEATRNELAARAARGGRSLQEYLRRELVAPAERPDRDEVWNGVAEFEREHGVRWAPDEVVDAIHAERADTDALE